MAYVQQTWIDGPTGNTPINAARLTYMENGIAAATALASSVVGPSGTLVGAQPLLSTAALQTGNFAASANQVVPCSAVGGSFTVTLPTGMTMGTIIAVKLLTTSGSNTVTVQSSGGDSINSTGTTSAVLQLTGESFEFVSSGAGLWYLYDGQKSLSSLDTRYFGTSGTPVFGGNATVAASRPIQLRRDTLANWLANSTVVLAAGEVAYESDTQSWKVGDGVTTWAALTYPRQPDVWTPDASGLIAATADGMMLPSQGPITTGRPLFFPVRIKRNVAIGNLMTGFVNTTTPASNANTYMAIYACTGGPGSSGGALLGQTAEFSSAVNGVAQALLLEPISGGAITAQSIGEWVYLMLLTSWTGSNAQAAQWIASRLYGTNFTGLVTGTVPRVYTNSSGSTLTTPPSTVPTLTQSNSNIVAWVAATQ